MTPTPPPATSTARTDDPAPRAALAARAGHAVVAAVILFGLIIQLTLLFTGGADANSGDTGDGTPLGTRTIRLFSFFTIQSNIILGVVSAMLAWQPLRDGRVWRSARLVSVLAIVITGLVFALVLAPIVEISGWALVASVCFHYISPGLGLAMWLLFEPRRRLTGPVVLGAFAWPVAWLIYTFIRGAVVDWYPYPFLNATELGLGRAVGNSLLVLLLGAVIAVVLMALDRRLPAIARQEPAGQGSARR